MVDNPRAINEKEPCSSGRVPFLLTAAAYYLLLTAYYLLLLLTTYYLELTTDGLPIATTK